MFPQVIVDPFNQYSTCRTIGESCKLQPHGSQQGAWHSFSNKRQYVDLPSTCGTFSIVSVGAKKTTGTPLSRYLIEAVQHIVHVRHRHWTHLVPLFTSPSGLSALLDLINEVLSRRHYCVFRQSSSMQSTRSPRSLYQLQ